MVKRLRLNDKTVRELIPEEDRDYQVFDTEIRGLSIWRAILRVGLPFRRAPAPHGDWPLA